VENCPGGCHIFEGEEYFRVQELVEYLLIAFILAQETIVKVTVFGGVDPHKISSALVLQDCLDNNLLLPLRELEEAVQVLFLDPVEFADVLEVVVSHDLYFASLLSH